jgi:hypothetical protein
MASSCTEMRIDRPSVEWRRRGGEFRLAIQ